MRAGSQQPVNGGLDGLPVIDADGQISCPAAHCIRVGSQQPVNGGLDGLPVFDADPVSVCAVCDGRGDDARVADAEGQIDDAAEQFITRGSQHAPLLPVNFALGLGVIVFEGQIFMVDVHCIFVGSQHPDMGVALASLGMSRRNAVGEGVGVVISDITSEHIGSPGVQDPRWGSQHRMPLKLVSPAF